MHIYSQIENHYCLAERVPKGAEEIATWISMLELTAKKLNQMATGIESLSELFHDGSCMLLQLFIPH